MKNNSLWTPTRKAVKKSFLKKFITELNQKYSLSMECYEDIYEFSTHEKEKFWSLFWDFSSIIGSKGNKSCLNESSFEHVQWFPDAKLNYAENILKNRSKKTAIIFNGEHQLHQEMTFEELYVNVSKMVQFFKSIHLKKGDRVAFLANNAPQTVVCVLAASAVGAISSLCSTDFGVQGIVERIAQIEPTLFIYFDHAIYNGKKFSQIGKVKEIIPKIPSLKNVIKINYFLSDSEKCSNIPNESLYRDILKNHDAKEIEFEQVSFSHPLYIMYSSGTTGNPKCIVHGHGGVLVQHRKEHMLHFDIKPQERVFYYTTCGWMMWQWLVSALASDATIIMYDGSPFYPNPLSLLEYLNQKNVSFFGTSAKYIDSLRKLKINIKENFTFSHLKTIGSTGSVLLPENFDYVYKHWKTNVCLASLSGGTDILSCFVLGCSIKPVIRGEIQSLGLGMQVEIFDVTGHSVKEKPGELVCTAPFPSTPVCFWNDPDGKKYHKSYFEKYKNVWHQADWAQITKNNGCIIYGRSDTTLNSGGVRIGTAEIYRQVEQFSSILESVVTEYYFDGDSKIILFVKLEESEKLQEKDIDLIKETIRRNCSPRHVPANIVQVPDIPKTKSGKIMELAVKNILNNKEVTNRESMLNPESLAYFNIF